MRQSQIDNTEIVAGIKLKDNFMVNIRENWTNSNSW